MRLIQKKIGVTPDGQLGPITAAAIMKYMQLSPEEAAHFIGQCAWESKSFTQMKEDFSRYTEDNLLTVFGKYFEKERQVTINDKVIRQKASDFVGHPEKIGSWVYANRMGNGPFESGEGYLFRGRGPIQLTGKRNYQLFAGHIKDGCILSDPDLVAEKYALESARFYFDTNNIWRHCAQVNDDSILTVSRIINLGSAASKSIPNHLNDRIFQTNRFYAWLK